MAGKTATVTVCCCLPQGIVFTLPGGRRLAVRGYPVSGLMAVDGTHLRGGRYGKIPGVPREDWEWVRRRYGGSAYFRTRPPLLFAESDARAAEQTEARHGREQVDVWQGEVKTEPETGGSARARGDGV